jgi:hypothetical protein
MSTDTTFIRGLARALPWRRRVRWRYALVLYFDGLRQRAVRVASEPHRAEAPLRRG